MAKGWESKGVEEQLAERENAASAANVPAAAALRAGAEKERTRQNLELKKEQILNERTSNAHRRASLAAALHHIEQQLRALDET